MGITVEEGERLRAARIKVERLFKGDFNEPIYRVALDESRRIWREIFDAGMARGDPFYLGLQQAEERAMAQVITRPDHEQPAPDLKAEYDRVDQWWTGQLQLIEQILRDMSQARAGSVHCDFNAMRYDAMKRLCLTMANEIHRDLERSQLKRADRTDTVIVEDLLMPSWHHFFALMLKK